MIEHYPDWLTATAVQLLSWHSRPHWRAMQQALTQPAQAQQNLLTRLLEQSARSRYGQSRGLGGPNPRHRFEQLPPCDYDELQPWVEQAIATGERPFSPDPVRFYERTSGSSGAVKHVPYNRSMLQAFDRMFRIWAYDLLQSGLQLRSGRSFMSVSPPLLGATDQSHARIGSRDDTDYLSGSTARLLRPYLVAPAAALQLQQATAFKDVICAALLAEARLEVLSLWNPWYGLILLQHLAEHGQQLAAELAQGPLQRGGRHFRLPAPTAARRATLARASASGDWTPLWPQLQLISCWTDAEAARPAAKLAAAFPGVALQGKGLLATEGPISVPLQGAPAPVPLLQQVYLELALPDGSLLPLSAWRDGDVGEIVLTQPAGWLRYRLRDRVAVNGFYRATPCIQFLGRAGRVVDLVGEKLAEDFVRPVLATRLPRAGFATLCPVSSGNPPFYALLTDQAEFADIAGLDQALSASPHYRLARALGQLGPLQYISRPELAKEVHAIWGAHGMSAGNVKEQSLWVQTTFANQIWQRLNQIG